MFETKCCGCWRVYEELNGQKKAISAFVKMETKYPEQRWV